MSKQPLTMTQRTFDEGSPFPPLQPGTLRLYSMRFCPYAQRTRLVLAHKNIPHETINVHLKRKPSWLLARNPKGRVPVLEDSDGHVVFESVITCQYLDDIYPENRLTPTDPYKKACDRLLEGYCDQFMKAFYQHLFTDGQSEEAHATIQTGLQLYEKELERRQQPGPFFGGENPTMLDYLVWPWFERLPMLKLQLTTSSNKDQAGFSLVYTRAAGITTYGYPYLYQWMSAMYQLPAVLATMFEPAMHRQFGHSQLTADPDYDMGLENEPPLPSAQL